MTREALREIAVRRQGDADVRVLLLEIRRLRGVVLCAHEVSSNLSHQEGLNRDYAEQRLIELLGEEPAIAEANSVTEIPVKRETEGDRATKRRARENLE